MSAESLRNQRVARAGQLSVPDPADGKNDKLVYIAVSLGGPLERQGVGAARALATAVGQGAPDCGDETDWGHGEMGSAARLWAFSGCGGRLLYATVFGGSVFGNSVEKLL